METDGLVEAAFWVTIGWGIGVAFHVASYFIGEPGPDSALYQKSLTEERERDAAAQQGASHDHT